MSFSQPQTSANSDLSDSDQVTWFTDAIEYNEFADEPFGEDSIFKEFAYNQKKDENAFSPFQVPTLDSGLSAHPSMSSFSNDQFARRTISSPLISLSGPHQQAFSPIPTIPGTQSTLSFNQQARVSRMLAPVNQQQQQQEDVIFLASLHDPSLSISPHILGFIPFTLWQERFYTFGELVTDFFQRKNHSSCRFSYKLYNALRLSLLSPQFAFLVGVSWLNDQIIRVDKRAFARLLGIKSIDGSLFHQQGNFPSHGFVEVPAEDVPKVCPNVDLTGVDFDNVRLLIHSAGVFVRTAMESDIVNCRWANAKR